MTTVIKVGQDCQLWDIVSALEQSSTFRLVVEKLFELALELGASSEFVSTVQRRILHDKCSNSIALHDVFEDWLSRKGEEATLDSLLEALAKFGLNESRATLLKAFPRRPSSTIRQFAKPPRDVETFLNFSESASDNYLLISSLDASITSRKLIETVDQCQAHTFKEFLDFVSSQNDSDCIHVVTVDDIREIKLILKFKPRNVRLLAITNYQTLKEFCKLIEEDASQLATVQIGNDEMEWEDLLPAYQFKLLEEIEEMLQIKLEENELGKVINGQVLVDCINGRKPCLLKDTLLPRLPYYVNRTLRSRHVISRKIFEHESSHIFVFSRLICSQTSSSPSDHEPLARHELSTLTRKSTANSSEVILEKEVKCQFVVLDNPNHFPKICSKTTEPVHWLAVAEDGTLMWLQSNGNVQYLQKFVAEKSEQILLREEDICEVLAPGNNSPVCIVDCPGMGKSVILSEIGRRLKEMYTTREVIFLKMNELVKEVRNRMKTNQDNLLALVKMSVSKLASDSDLGQTYIQHKLGINDNTDIILVELLLDGLDEVESANQSLAEEILKTLRVSMRTLRLWVNSRSHFLQKLEITLDTLGYKILPFKQEDQIHFLTGYWSRDSHSEEDQTRIADFAATCLKNLSSREMEIASIPLHCLMIAETFQDQLTAFLEHPAAPTLNIHLKTIPDLYQILIQNKFETYQNSGTEAKLSENLLFDMHYKLALKVLFPEANFFKNVKIQAGEILKVGIMESGNVTNSARFLHRTIAEYFVAHFVAQSLTKEDSWTNEFVELLIYKLLTFDEEVCSRYKIIYEKDVLMGYDEIRGPCLPRLLKIGNDPCEKPKWFLEAVLPENLHEVLPKIAKKLGASSEFVDDLKWQNIHQKSDRATAIDHVLKDWFRRDSGATLSNLLTALFNCELFESCDALIKKFRQCYFVLRRFVGVLPDFIDFLFKDISPSILSQSLLECSEKRNLEQLRKLIQAATCSNKTNILQLFVMLTSAASQSQLKSMFSVDLLLSACEIASVEAFKLVLFQFERVHIFDPPLERALLGRAVMSGHYSVAEYLLNERGLAEKVSSFNYKHEVNGGSLLHLCVRYRAGESEEKIEQRVHMLHLLLSYAPSLLEQENAAKCTPLLSDKVELRLLQELIKKGANTLHQDAKGNTVLHKVTSHELTPNDYHTLLTAIPPDQLREVINVTNMHGDTPLRHLLLRQDPLLTTLDVLRIHGADFNHVDENGYSILATAIRAKRKVDTLRKLVDCGASLKWKSGDNQDQNLLHLAAQDGHAEAIEFLVKEKGFNVHEKSGEGKSPLQYAKMSPECYSPKDQSKACMVLWDLRGT